MKDQYNNFERYDLDGHHAFFSGRLPAALIPDATQFEVLWQMHPDEYHEIMMPGGPVRRGSTRCPVSPNGPDDASRSH